MQKPLTLLILLIGAAVTVNFLAAAQALLVPLVLAIFLSYLIMAIEESIRGYFPLPFREARWASMILALVMVMAALWLIGWIVAENLGQVAAAVPAYEDNLRAVLASTGEMLNLGPVLTPEELARWVGEEVDLEQMIGQFANAIQLIARNAFLIVLYTGCIMLERGAFTMKLLQLATTDDHKDRISHTIGDITRRMRQYIALKTLICILVGAGSWVIMIVIGIDFAGFWAVLIFLLNYIPYIGSFIAVAFPVALTLVQFGSLPLFLVSLISLVAVQVTVGNIIEPRLMGNSLNLSPLVILIAMVSWGSIWGIVGAFLAVPLTVIMLIIFAQFSSTRPLAVLLSRDGQV